MESKKAGRGSRSEASSPSLRERKSRKPAVEREKSEKNPLRDKMQSAKDSDKRKARREFFTKDKKTGERGERSDRYSTKRRDERSSDRRENKRRDDRSSDRYEDKRRDERSSDRRENRRRDDRSSDRYEDKRREDRSSDRRESRRRDDRSSDRYENKRRDDRSSERYETKRRDSRSSDRYETKRRDEQDSERYKQRDFVRREEREKKPSKERRSKVLDSEIMREVVKRRRATGRSSNKPKVLSLAWGEERGAIRLNKYIANGGICSRREADDLITAGVILVNGEVVTELGTKVMPTDEVRYEDKILQREKPVYILLNKPKNFITTTDDEKSRDNVMMLIEGACSQRVYPVGRLDRNTTGLLLFTNDGEMTKKLTHPRYGVKKIYQVELDRDMSLADFEKLANGIELEDGLMKPDDLAFVEGDKRVLGITLHSGKNRVVRRLFAHLGYEVEKLDRVYYAGLTKKDIPRGEWRFLRPEEINILKMSL